MSEDARVNLDWKAIRPKDGSNASGFEELCIQLARAERPKGSRFERKGTPDAGVECYAVLADGKEWGWQAKYFDTLGNTQWSEMDKSVKTALNKHPQLVRYFVCIPLDRPDARIKGVQSARQRWDKHVAKWTGWASEKGIPAIEFVYWGSSELLERLKHPQYAGMVYFWFGVHGFDNDWFTVRLNEAIKTAGPRYTPEIHVALPIVSEFDAFGRNEEFFEGVKACALNIRRDLRAFESYESKIDLHELDSLVSEIILRVNKVLTELGSVKAQPIGDLPFSKIAEHAMVAEKAIDKLEHSLLEREHEFDIIPQTDKESQFLPSINPFREYRYRLSSLSAELEKTREMLEHAEEVAGSSLMILTGKAGTGKTHLLCDIARQRVAEGRPTILLMGQWFVSNNAPWTQVLQQLDLAGSSAGEFIGALESVAQAAGCRALVMIDAINEGSGRLIWPAHLAAFLTLLEKSSWIGVVLSIRSSYENIVIPKEVQDHAFCITHQGFADHEYDATRTFFIYYGLELPSTPLLVPEFSNPLFLKTLCKGLQAKGERRLPRGFHGITVVFDLYLNAINEKLAAKIGFDPRELFVRKALERIANNLTVDGKQWLALSKAKEIVNALVPGLDYEHSLYRELVAEGALMEEGQWHDGAPEDDIVFIAYERFADHLIAKTLLDHLDAKSPVAAFAPGGPLAFICDKSSYVSPGLLEAVCIQIPERIGQELIFLEPKALDLWEIGDAFRQSLIWRSPAAFSKDTFKAINKLIRTQHDWDDTLNVLLTLAILPKHPLNAQFLDQRLRKDTMPDRDAWWSIYLHNAWGTKGAVDRLVDWASSIEQSSVLDDETIDLCANTLAWMFTTSNRFLRDRATKALANLLTGRLDAVSLLVHRFNDVDDKYVTERVYAVAYGTAMRSQDPIEIGKLARCVYNHIFANGSPPAHILLRDYARGVIERAIYLGADINVNEQLIRPPYKSEWPIILSEEDIKPLLPDWSRGSYDSGDLEWSRNCIGSSVMHGDFAHYVIGDNWGHLSNSWLSLRIDEPIWKSPKERLDILLKDFSADEIAVWNGFKVAEESLNRLFWNKWNGAIQASSELEDTADGVLPDTTPTGDCNPELESAERVYDMAIKKLESVLTEDHAIALESVLAAMKNQKEQQPPGFDLRLIKRYILWRVFDLGWTIARFGQFDRYNIRSYGREASKPERIGKKYQWIAYHEIMALVADHFQHRERFLQEGADGAYEGPWQEHLRDIDPSCTLRTIPGGTSWNGHSIAWWGSSKFEDWGEPDRSREWVMNYETLPRVDELLRVTHPQDNTRWLNVNGYFSWTPRRPADQELGDFERRELWYICNGYLIHSRDTDAFMQWAKDIDFWGRWMPEASVIYAMFLGEHGWAPASQYFSDAGWTRPSRDCPVDVHVISLEYLQEISGFDCSLDDSFRLRLPAGKLVSGLRTQWSGNCADYLDSAGQLAAFDPTAHEKGPVAFLLREDLLTEFLAREGLTLCWTILGEKHAIGAGHPPKYQYSLRMTGAYMLCDNDLKGFLKYHNEFY